MPFFISNEELSRLSNDAVAVAHKADAYIGEMFGELETVKAKADASAITADQTCSILEQTFLSISRELSDLQSRNVQLRSSLDAKLAHLAQVQAQKHQLQLHLQSIGKEGEIERMTREISELHKSKRQLLEMIEHKDMEIADKNSTIKTYLDNIVNLTDKAAEKEARLSETEAELVRVQAACTRFLQDFTTKRFICRGNESESLYILDKKVLAEDINLKEQIKKKDAQMEELMNVLSTKQDMLSTLEQDLASTKLELNESNIKLNEIVQSEAKLSSDMEKQKKLISQLKRRADVLAKANQALSKQVEELKQGKRSMGDAADAAGDQVMKLKEEKDSIIQILEKTVERQREELKKEKDEHQSEKAKRIKCVQTIMATVKKSKKGKATVLNELQKYQQALNCLSEKLGKLKHAEDNLPEGTSALQLLSGTITNDNAAPYVSAVDDFERVARSILNDLGAGSISGDIPSATPSTVISDQSPVIAPSTAAVTSQIQPAKTSNVYLKTGMKLHPQYVKAEEAHGDMEMTENANVQGTVSQQNQQPVLTRLASELSKDLQVPRETCTDTDLAEPVLKKSKGSNAPAETSEAQAAVLSENRGCPQGVDVAQGRNEDGEIVEESDKSNTGNLQTAAENDQMPKPALTAAEPASTGTPPDSEMSKQVGSSVTPESDEVKQICPVSRTSTVINIQERARERAMIREQGVVRSPVEGVGRGGRHSMRIRRGRGGGGGLHGRGQNSEI